MCSAEFTFRLLRRADFDLLGRWLDQPHVHRWWFHDTDPDALEADFGPAIDKLLASHHYVASASIDGAPARPIGLIQTYLIHSFPESVEELSPILEVPAEAGSIDYFIGEPDLVGRGIGSAMISTFVGRLGSIHPEIGRLIVPVSSANVASWKALAKSGFVKLAEGELEADNPIDDDAHVIMGCVITSP